MASAETVGHRIWPIHIGGVHAGSEGDVVRTVLGSCIAVCLHDSKTGIGGMNHFMLPEGGADSGNSSRYGVHAMELLINRCMTLGGERKRFEAKVFGGAHVLRVKEHADNVPQRNIRFALEFLQLEGIPVIKRDLGGYAAREVLFFPGTGKILLKRLSETGRDLEQTIVAEERSLRQRAPVVAPVEEDDNITLF